MKNRILVLSLFCFSFISLFSQNEETEKKIVELYNNEDYFEFMRQYELHKDSISFPLTNAIMESTLNLFCNRREAFEESSRHLIDNYQEEIGSVYVVNEYFSRILNFIELGKYKEANEASAYFLNNMPSDITQQDVVDYFEYIYSLSEALLPYPPKQVVFPEDTVSIPLSFKKTGLGESIFIEGAINGKHAIPFRFDTGAGSNCAIHEKFVGEYNIRILDDSIKIEAKGMQSKLETKWGIIDSLSLGEVTIYNIPVLILSDEKELQSENDEMLNTPDSLKHFKQAIIGWQLMESLGEMHLYPQKETITFLKTDPEETKKVNMILHKGKQPFVELLSGANRLTFVLDTGSSFSFLSSLYYENNEDWILKTLTSEKLGIGEIGGAYKIDIYRLPQLSLQLGNIPFELKDIAIIPSIPQRYTSGYLGVDFIRLFDKVVLDFKNMYIEVEK